MPSVSGRRKESVRVPDGLVMTHITLPSPVPAAPPLLSFFRLARARVSTLKSVGESTNTPTNGGGGGGLTLGLEWGGQGLQWGGEV